MASKSKGPKTRAIVPLKQIESLILSIRGQRVMLDADLAGLYGVETKILIQAVKRNLERFPQDFMFQLNNREFRDLRSQFVTSSWGGTRKLPRAFIEHGKIMAANFIKKKRPPKGASARRCYLQGSY